MVGDHFFMMCVRGNVEVLDSVGGFEIFGFLFLFIYGRYLLTSVCVSDL